MKKPNEKTNAFLYITPSEEQAVLVAFENFVANYGKNEKPIKDSKKQVVFPFLKTCTAGFTKVYLTLAFFLVSFCAPLFSQNINTWVGGTPGQKTKWDCPKNWSMYKVPDEFSNVYIPNTLSTTFSNPVIKSGWVEVNSLSLAPDAFLTIEENAQVVVLEYTEGILKDNLILHGALLVLESMEEPKKLQANLDGEQ